MQHIDLSLDVDVGALGCKSVYIVIPALQAVLAFHLDK